MYSSMMLHGDPLEPGSLKFHAKSERRGSNANAVGLVFTRAAPRYENTTEITLFNLNTTEITLFNLNDTDADILAGVGLLGEEDRKKVAALVNDLLSKQGD